MIAALYNLNSRSSENDPILDWQDFFTEWKEPTPPQTDDEMYEHMKLWANATGGMVS